MRLPSKRRLKLTGRASIAKMSAERQRLSFFLVIIFLAVFGLIVLAEVFFVDKEVVLGGKARSLPACDASLFLFPGQNGVDCNK